MATISRSEWAPALHYAQGTVLGILVAVAGIAPRAAATLVFVLYLLMLAEDALARRPLPWQNLKSAVPLAAFALIAWAAVTLLWSADPRAGLEMVVYALALVVAAVYVANRLFSAEGAARRKYLRGAVIGGLVGVAYLSLELVFDTPITRFALNLAFSFLPAKHKGLTVIDGRITEVHSYYFNRHAGALALYIAPLLPLMRQYLPAKLARPTMALAAALAGIGIFLSDSATAQAAFVVGALVLAIAHFAERFARGLLFAGLGTAFLFAIPIAWALYNYGLHQAEWLPYSARSRIAIWSYNESEARKRPILGAGLRTSRALQKRLLARTKNVHELDLARRPGWHAHNVYLQSWYELGGIGALLAAIIGFVMLRRAGAFSENVRPFALAYSASAMTVAAFGWGMWQTWLMATFVTGIWLLNLAEGQRGLRSSG